MSARNRVSAASDAAISHAIDAVDAAATAVSFINSSIHPVMDALFHLAEFNSDDLGALRLRLDLVRHLAQVGRALVEDAGGCMETYQADLQSTLDALKAGAA